MLIDRLIGSSRARRSAKSSSIALCARHQLSAEKQAGRRILAREKPGCEVSIYFQCGLQHGNTSCSVAKCFINIRSRELPTLIGAEKPYGRLAPNGALGSHSPQPPEVYGLEPISMMCSG
jgi:hypothetical protein